MRHAATVYALLLLSAVSAAVRAAELADAQPDAVVFRSGSAAVPLIELYTSEGCSSCPPADRWLSSLKDHPDLWTTFVPVAFHVDYWDYIGWQDRFAAKAHGERQRRYFSEGRLRGVYTPGVMAGGEEWRAWRRGAALPGARGPGGELTGTLGVGGLRVQYQPPPNTTKQRFRVAVAWLAMGEQSIVRAGENRGKTLVNDFVVLASTTQPLLAGNESKQTTPRLEQRPAGADALAIWVMPADEQRPLQATGGWLPAT